MYQKNNKKGMKLTEIMSPCRSTGFSESWTIDKLAKSEPPSDTWDFLCYQRSLNWLEIWRQPFKGSRRKSLAEKLFELLSLRFLSFLL